MSKYVLEVCCGSLEDAIRAEKGGADRIQINTAMLLGGLSCGRTLLRQVKEALSIPIYCMVRCKSGGFYYTDDEMELMFNQASQLLEGGASGIVFGFLNADKTVCEEKVTEMVDLCHSYGRPAIFSRAFDSTPDQEEAIQTLIRLGVDRVQTSGGMDTAKDGLERIHELQKKYGSQIEIMPAGSITAQTVDDLINGTECTIFHSTCKTAVPDYPGDLSQMHDEVGLQNVKDLRQKLA